MKRTAITCTALWHMMCSPQAVGPLLFKFVIRYVGDAYAYDKKGMGKASDLSNEKDSHDSHPPPHINQDRARGDVAQLPGWEGGADSGAGGPPSLAVSNDSGFPNTPASVALVSPVVLVLGGGQTGQALSQRVKAELSFTAAAVNVGWVPISALYQQATQEGCVEWTGDEQPLLSPPRLQQQLVLPLASQLCERDTVVVMLPDDNIAFQLCRVLLQRRNHSSPPPLFLVMCSHSSYAPHYRALIAAVYSAGSSSLERASMHDCVQVLSADKHSEGDLFQQLLALHLQRRYSYN
jgi:hypothetical protein